MRICFPVAAASLLVALCEPVVAGPPTKSVDDARPGWAENMITHGPMLGRVTNDSIAIWGRTLNPGEFVVRYGEQESLLDQTSDAVITELAHDNTGFITIDGLKPGTRYWYELQITESYGRSARTGTFKTLPKGEVDPKWNPAGLFNFSFEFACGNNQIPRYGLGPQLPSYRKMLETGVADDINFAILNGDWLYEIRRDYNAVQWAAEHDVIKFTPDKSDSAVPLLDKIPNQSKLFKRVPAEDEISEWSAKATNEFPEVLTHTPQLTGVWENYKWFLDQGKPLVDWHSRVPSYFTYDDHEILNDIWGAGQTGLRDRRATFRDIGVRGWDDYLGWANEDDNLHATHLGTAKLKQGSNVLVDESADFTKLDYSQLTNLHIHWGTPDSGVNDNALDGVGGDPNAGVYSIVKVLGPNQLQVDRPAVADTTISYSIGRKAYWKKTVGNVDIFVLDTRGMRGMHDVKNPWMKGLKMLGDEQHDWLVDGVKKSEADFIFVVSSVNFMIPHVGGEAIRGDGGKDEAWTVFLEEREELIKLWDSKDAPVFVLTGDLHNSFMCQITDNVYELASGPHNSNNHAQRDEGDRPANGRFQWQDQRPIEILWSTWFPNDIERRDLMHPTYCVVKVNNVFDAPTTFRRNNEPDSVRKIAFPRPQVIIQYFNGLTGDLRFAHSVLAAPKD